MNALSVLENLLVILGIAGFFIAPIAWVVFIVSCFRAKNSYSESIRKRRRIIRTVSLITAILFTLCVIYLCFALSESPAAPLPEATSISVERFAL